MSLNLANLKQINIKRQRTVYGYIRELEASFQLDIPQGVIDIFVLFYGDPEKWDIKLCKDTDAVSFDEQRRIVTNKSQSVNVYGERIIDSGYFKWKFEVKFGGGGSDSLMIGLWRINDNKPPPINHTHFTDGVEQGYGYHCSSGDLISTDVGYGIYKQYGPSDIENSIIEMTVDFDSLSLSFKVDDQDLGKAFDITQDKYRLAVYFTHKGDYVKILE